MTSNNKNSNIKELLDQKNIKQISSYIEGLNKLFIDDISRLSDEIQVLEEKKQEILNVKKVMDETTIPDIITLNIGGMKYQTTKEILRKTSGSFFDLMLSGEIDIKPIHHKPDTYFIDRDGTIFKYILDYMKDSEGFSLQSSFMKEVLKEIEFYKLKPPSLSKIKTNGISLNSLSTIVDDNIFDIFNLWINGTDKRSNFNLLFRASENKFSALEFHKHCDDKGPTIVIIKTEKDLVFGGYNSQSWNSDEVYYGDNKCFLFEMKDNVFRKISNKNNDNYVI